MFWSLGPSSLISLWVWGGPSGDAGDVSTEPLGGWFSNAREAVLGGKVYWLKPGSCVVQAGPKHRVKRQEQGASSVGDGSICPSPSLPAAPHDTFTTRMMLV